jgi:hypothetical protein
MYEQNGSYIWQLIKSGREIVPTFCRYKIDPFFFIRGGVFVNRSPSNA